MALIEKISSSDLFHMACRMDRGDSFGYKGWARIGDYLEELSTDENIEIDIIGICCDYDTAESTDDFHSRYDGKFGADFLEEWDEMSDAEKLEAIEDYLNENTSVVCCEDGCIIWAAF